MKENKGFITRIVGPVIDVKFEDQLPNIYNALHLKQNDGSTLVLEVEQQLTSNTVRCLALGPSDGLTRKMEVIDTGKPIMVPVGEETLGRIFNVIGQVVDDGKPLVVKQTAPIHKNAPALTDQETSATMLETGIKVIDLIAPFAKGGKVGAFGGAGVGKTVIIQELIRNSRVIREAEKVFDDIINPAA